MGSEAKIREWGVLIGWCPLDCYNYYRVSKNWVLSPPSKDEGMLPFSIPILVYHPPSTIQCISSLVQNLFVCTLSIGFPRYIVPKGGAASPTPPPPPPIYFEFFRTIASSDLIWPFLISILISTLVLQLLLQPQTLKSTTAATMLGGPKTFLRTTVPLFSFSSTTSKGSWTTILLSTTPSFQLVIHFSIFSSLQPQMDHHQPNHSLFSLHLPPPSCASSSIIQISTLPCNFLLETSQQFQFKRNNVSSPLIVWLWLYVFCSCFTQFYSLHTYF